MTQKSTPTAAISTPASRIDQEVVARAYRKVMDRQELTGEERTALKRHEKEKEERLRWQYYSSIPQKHWRQISGRQTKVINEQATRYGRPRRLRSMRQFAESEIIIPAGPFAGRRFRCARQPFTGLWFDEVDSGRWSRYVATGPTQSGKSLACFVIPILYHLFELGETVICGFGHRSLHPHPRLGPAIGAGHAGGRSAFVNEHQAIGADAGCDLPPGLPQLPHPFAPAFAGVQRLFLRGSFSFWRIRDMVESLTRTC